MRFEGHSREQVLRWAEPKLPKIAKILAEDSSPFEIACCFIENNRMSAVPQAAFAVCQLRKCSKHQQALFAGKLWEDEDEKENKSFEAKNKQEGREPTPLKYNSKLMNSIWGLYNRYSVHNFKKIAANDAALLATWDLALRPKVAEGPAATSAAVIIHTGH